MHDSFTEKTRVTIGADFATKELQIEDDKVALQIWDTAGQEKYRSLGKAYYRGSDICILVFDVTDRNSFAHLNDWMDSFMILSNIEEDKINFPFVVVGNKIDFSKRQITKDEATKWCTENGNVEYFEVSAKTGENIDLLFKEATKKAIKKYNTFK